MYSGDLNLLQTTFQRLFACIIVFILKHTLKMFISVHIEMIVKKLNLETMI